MKARRRGAEVGGRGVVRQGSGTTYGVRGWGGAVAHAVTTTAGGRPSASGMHLGEDHL